VTTSRNVSICSRNFESKSRCESASCNCSIRGCRLPALLSGESRDDEGRPWWRLIKADPASERELDVLRFISQGLDNAAIAEQLVISVNTIKWHVHDLMNKLNASNRAQLVARARELQLLSYGWLIQNRSPG
jgi:DNA-binding NarL/FixJ family response regulator